uniref:Cytochrome c1 n=1 Tax=Globodera rostochiensis TaxID=31243 RepID=A0A914HIC3_GLORO
MMLWSTAGISLRKTAKFVLFGSLATGASVLLYSLENAGGARAYDFVVHPSALPWSHNGPMDAIDMKSVRRGYQVYKQFMTSDEAKTEAAEAMIPDLDDDGNEILRPGMLNDHLPRPYKNNKAAAAANSGALPPDLSLIVWAREGGEDYIFHLLTGYAFDTPAGVDVDEGKAFNPYFPNGSVIAMPQQLFDEGIEYEDGTPATMTQQAKDVCTFLRWGAEQWHDTRKRWFWKLMTVMPILLVVLLYGKRHVWALLKSEKVIYRRLPGREWTPDSTAPKPPKDEPTLKVIAPPKKTIV